MRQQRLDGLAIGASSICLTHCLVLPAILIALRALAAVLAVPESFQFWALIAAVPTSMTAIGMVVAGSILLAIAHALNIVGTRHLSW